jgi:hypothetical protein
MTPQRKFVQGFGVTPAYIDVPLCADVIRHLPLGAIAAHARNKQVASAAVLRQDAITADAKNCTINATGFKLDNKWCISHFVHIKIKFYKFKS